MINTVNSKIQNQYRDYERRITYRTQYISKYRNCVSLDNLLRKNDTHLRAEHLNVDEQSIIDRLHNSKKKACSTFYNELCIQRCLYEIMNNDDNILDIAEVAEDVYGDEKIQLYAECSENIGFVIIADGEKRVETNCSVFVIKKSNGKIGNDFGIEIITAYPIIKENMYKLGR